ncbi:unnamed protein product [Sphagnum tenellum]
MGRLPAGTQPEQPDARGLNLCWVQQQQQQQQLGICEDEQRWVSSISGRPSFPRSLGRSGRHCQCRRMLSLKSDDDDADDRCRLRRYDCSVCFDVEITTTVHSSLEPAVVDTTSVFSHCECACRLLEKS